MSPPAKAIPLISAVFGFIMFFSFSLTVASGGKTEGRMELWCVAKNNADDEALQAAINWACGEPPAGGVDCSAVQQGGACFLPEDLQFHASYAFNEYYRRKPTEAGACDFAGTALLTQLDPSRSVSNVDQNCKFPSSFAVSNGSTTTGSKSDSDSDSDSDSGPGNAYYMSIGSNVAPYLAEHIVLLLFLYFLNVLNGLGLGLGLGLFECIF